MSLYPYKNLSLEDLIERMGDRWELVCKNVNHPKFVTMNVCFTKCSIICNKFDHRIDSMTGDQKICLIELARRAQRDEINPDYFAKTWDRYVKRRNNFGKNMRPAGKK